MLKMMVNGVTYQAKGLWGSVNRIFYQKPKVLDTKTSLRLILDKNARLPDLVMVSLISCVGGH